MSKEIPLSGQRGKGLCAVVDDEDFDTLDQYTWHLANNGYVTTFTGGRKNVKCVLMHRLLMNPPDGFEVDHRNGNKLDNRRDNLRHAQRGENARNLRRHKKFSSRFKGVSWNGKDHLWDAHIGDNHKKIHLGQFSSEIQAALVYNTAAQERFGAFASLNDIRPDTPDDIRYRQGKAMSTSRTSKYLGVSLHKQRGTWSVALMVNGKRFRKNGFRSEEEAAKAYDKLALEHRGAKAFLNFPPNQVAQ